MADTPYYTASALRARVPDLVDADKYPDVVLTDLITEYEDKLERYRGVAYTTRSAVSETHTLNHCRSLVLNWRRLRTITSIAVVARDGTSTSLVSTDWEPDLVNGIVDLGGYYTGQATIVFSHYLTTSPSTEVLRGCREFVRSTALRENSKVGRDVVRQGFEGGSSTVYLTPDWENGIPTAYSAVNEIWNGLTDYRLPGVG